MNDISKGTIIGILVAIQNLLFIPIYSRLIYILKLPIIDSIELFTEFFVLPGLISYYLCKNETKNKKISVISGVLSIVTMLILGIIIWIFFACC
jgi:hypothetical protein